MHLQGESSVLGANGPYGCNVTLAPKVPAARKGKVGTWKAVGGCSQEGDV